MRTGRITYKLARRIAIVAVGTTILALGLIMIVAPGPALLLIPVGLAILGLEFAWARAWLMKIRQSISASGARGRAEGAERHRRRHLG